MRGKPACSIIALVHRTVETNNCTITFSAEKESGAHHLGGGRRSRLDHSAVPPQSVASQSVSTVAASPINRTYELALKANRKVSSTTTGKISDRTEFGDETKGKRRQP